MTNSAIHDILELHSFKPNFRMFLKGDAEMKDKMSEKEIFANNLKFLIKQKRMNYKEFAAAIDTKYTTTLEWVNGRTFPRIEKLEVIADYFKVPKSKLLDEHLMTVKSFLDLENLLNNTLNAIETSDTIIYKKMKLKDDNVMFVKKTLQQIIEFLNEEHSNYNKRQEFEKMLALMTTKHKEYYE